MADIRLGVLGAGIMGQRVARAAHDTGRFTVAAVADADVGRAADLAGAYSAQVHAGVQDLFDGTSVDAVYVGLPHDLHLEACLAAARANVHVLIDKPLCNTQNEADQIQAVADRSSSTWMVGFSYRFRSEWRRAHQVIASGAIGTPYFVVDVVTEAYRSLPEWYWDSSRGGGTLQLQSHHVFDRIGWLLDSAPTELAARVVRLPGGAEKSAQISVEYASGASAGFSLSFGLGYDAPPATLCVVHGELGLIRLDADRTLHIVSRDGSALENHAEDDWMAREVGAFADGIDGADGDYPSVEDGVRALRCSLAAARAAEAETWIRFDD